MDYFSTITLCGSNFLVLLPTTLRTLVQITINLHKLGYPSHWLAGFLEMIICNRLYSVYRRSPTVPIVPAEGMKQHPSKKLQLSPWVSEIEIVVATALSALPFALRTPERFPHSQHIKVYTAYVEEVEWTPRGQVRPRVPSLAIVFVCKKSFLPRRQEPPIDIFSDDDRAGEKLQIVQSLRNWNLDLHTKRGTVSWLMSKDRFEAMKHEKWSLCMWRTDVNLRG